MTLLHIDGFDHYGDDETKMTEGVYEQVDSAFTLSNVNVRTGNRNISRDSSATDSNLIWITADEFETLGAGFSIYMDQMPSSDDSYALMSLIDKDQSEQLTVLVTSGGLIRVLRGDQTGQQIASSIFRVIFPGIHHHFEIGAKADTNSEQSNAISTIDENFNNGLLNYAITDNSRNPIPNIYFSTSADEITIVGDGSGIGGNAIRNFNLGVHTLLAIRFDVKLTSLNENDSGNLVLINTDGNIVFNFFSRPDIIIFPQRYPALFSQSNSIASQQLTANGTYSFSGTFTETGIDYVLSDSDGNVIGSGTDSTVVEARTLDDLIFGASNDKINTSGGETTIFSNVEIDIQTDVFTNGNGLLEIRIDGVTRISESGISNIETSNESYSGVAIKCGGSTAHGVTSYIDDWFIWNDQGAWNNSFIGDRRCFLLRPNQDTNIADFEPSSGSFGYKMIDDDSPDDDSTYIIAEAYLQSGSPLTGTSEFEIEELPDGSSLISAVNVVTRAAKTDSTSAEIFTSINSGADSLSQAAHALTTTYGYFSDIYEYDPSTISSLTKDGFDAISISITADDLDPGVAFDSPEDFVSPVAGLWTPAQITTSLWLDADDSATITLISGFVSQWDDKSGNARHAVQATAAQRPSVSSATLNGLDAINFDGSDDNMSISSFPTGQSAYSIYAVLRNDQDPPSAFAQSGIWNFTGDASMSTRNSHHPFTDSNLYHNFGSTTRKSLGNPAPALTSGHIFNMDSAAGSWQARLNASQIFTTATNTVGMQSTCYIGLSDPVDFNRFYDGVMAEIVVISSVLSQSDREKMEGYLAHKWGLESTLPGGHPYKSSPPEV